jgi:hypothetical protein
LSTGNILGCAFDSFIDAEDRRPLFAPTYLLPTRDRHRRQISVIVMHGARNTRLKDVHAIWL